MNAENSPSFYKDEFESPDIKKEPINVFHELENDIILLEGNDKRERMLSILLADLKWTINSEGKVSYVSPFVDNCIGNDAKSVIKKISSKYLTPSSIISCLIELEELIEIIRTSKNTKSRTLMVETNINEYNFKSVEIKSSAIFDLKGNVIGIQGLCKYLI